MTKELNNFINEDSNNLEDSFISIYQLKYLDKSKTNNAFTLTNILNLPPILLELLLAFKRPSPHFWSLNFEDPIKGPLILIFTPQGLIIWIINENKTLYYNFILIKNLEAILIHHENFTKFFGITNNNQLIYFSNLFENNFNYINILEKPKLINIYDNNNILIIYENNRVVKFNLIEMEMYPIDFSIFDYLNPFRKPLIYDSTKFIIKNNLIFSISKGNFTIFNQETFKLISNIIIDDLEPITFDIFEDTAFLLFNSNIPFKQELFKINQIYSNPIIFESQTLEINEEFSNLNLIPISNNSCCISSKFIAIFISFSGVLLNLKISNNNNGFIINSYLKEFGIINFITSNFGYFSINLNDPIHISNGIDLYRTLTFKFSKGENIKSIINNTNIQSIDFINFLENIINDNKISIEIKTKYQKILINLIKNNFENYDQLKLLSFEQIINILNFINQNQLFSKLIITSINELFEIINSNPILYSNIFKEILDLCIKTSNNTNFLKSNLIINTLEIFLNSLFNEIPNLIPIFLSYYIEFSTIKNNNIDNYIKKLHLIQPNISEDLCIKYKLYNTLSDLIHLSKNYEIFLKIYNLYKENIINKFLNSFYKKNYYNDLLEIGYFKEYHEFIYKIFETNILILAIHLIDYDPIKSSNFFYNYIIESKNILLDKAINLLSISLLCCFENNKNLKIKIQNRLLLLNLQKLTKINNYVLPSIDLINYFIQNLEKGLALSCYTCSFEDRLDEENSKILLEILNIQPILNNEQLKLLLIDTGAANFIPINFKNLNNEYYNILIESNKFYKLKNL